MKVALTFLGMMGFTVLANLLLKAGAVSGEPGQAAITRLMNWHVLGGLTSFGLAACCYIIILQWLPLHVATSFASAQYIAVILASTWFLDEPIGSIQWAGIALIALGIVILGWTQR